MTFLSSTCWSSEYAVAEYKDLQADTMALDLEGNIVLLAGQRCVALKNLNDSSDSIVKKIRNHKYDSTAAEWSPSSLNSNLCALTTNERVEILNVREGSFSVSHLLKHHTRRVTDLSWHRFERQLLASSSADALTLVWDIRDQRRPAVTFTSAAGGNKVQWNKLSSHLLATAHDGDIRIWDKRRPSAPVQYIIAHAAKINGMDWSQTHEYQLATCSQDSSVRFFDMTNPKRAESILPAPAPVWRARYTPWAEGLVTAILPSSEQGDSTLLLWSLLNLSVPVHTFVGPADIILEFSWRRDGDYHLVTWCRDRSLRVWRIEPLLQQLCGFESATDSSNEVDEVAGDVNLLDRGLSAVESLNFPSNESSTSFRLADELENIISVNTPAGLQFDQVDVENRSCLVKAQTNVHQVSLLISFPPAYPYNAAPSFQLDESSPLDHLLKTKLLKVLKQTAQQKVRRNRPCLESCLTQLLSTLEHTLQIQGVSMGRSDSGGTVNVVASSPVVDSPSVFSSFHDVYVPFPKYCGARFCSVGTLVCFSRPERLRGRLEATRRSFSGTSRFNVDNQNDSDLNSRRLINGGSRSSRTLGRIALKFPHRVLIYDLSKMFVVHKEFARLYHLDTSDVPSLCRHNTDLVLSTNLGRLDLIQAWTLAGLIASGSDSLESEDNDHFMAPWLAHPFSIDLIDHLIMHFANVSDVQMAAMLCYVFPQTNQNDNLILKTVREVVLSRYADLLLRWGLLDARATIAKSSFIFGNDFNRGLEFVTECQKCRKNIIGSGRCSTCHSWALRCALCRILVKGACNICLICGHGGHAEHIRMWFQNENVCPYGCGCKCLKEISVLLNDAK